MNLTRAPMNSEPAPRPVHRACGNGPGWSPVWSRVGRRRPASGRPPARGAGAGQPHLATCLLFTLVSFPCGPPPGPPSPHPAHCPRGLGGASAVAASPLWAVGRPPGYGGVGGGWGGVGGWGGHGSFPAAGACGGPSLALAQLVGAAGAWGEGWVVWCVAACTGWVGGGRRRRGRAPGTGWLAGRQAGWLQLSQGVWWEVWGWLAGSRGGVAGWCAG